MVHRGAGIRLKPTATPEAIRDAVQRVLDDTSYRAGARTLQSAIADHTGCVDIVTELEQMATAVRV